MSYRPATHLTARARVMAKPPAPPQPPPKERITALTLLRGLVLVLIVPTVVFAGVFAYGRYEHFSATARAPGEQGALVWSDGAVIFANKKEVAAWLRQHGGSIEGFEKNHPKAVELVSKAPRVSTQTKIAAGTKTRTAATTAATPTTPRTPKGAEAVAPTPGSNGDSRTNRISLYALAGVALLALLLACAPVAVLLRVPLLRLLQVPELRLLFGGVGAAIAAGLAVSMLLS